MTIMPVSGHDIGFSHKGWRRLEAMLKKAQVETPEENAYWDSMHALTARSSEIHEVKTNENTDIVKDPGSYWGGSEKFLGVSYSGGADIVLEGDIAFFGDDLEAAKEQIAKDFTEWSWENTPPVQSAVAELKGQVLSEDNNTHISAHVSSISKNHDGTVRITMNVHVEVTGNSSSQQARSREDEIREDGV